MKSINYIKAACLALMGAFTASCMELEPEADMGDSQVWSSADNFQLFANQFYSWTRDFTTSLVDSPHSDMRSDLMCATAINTYSQGTNTIPTTDSNYDNAYQRIYYTNLLLDRANSYSDPDEIEVPVAEAKFFRAYLHFELVQLYGDAILLTYPLDMDSEELYAARNDRGEVIDQVITDLEEAAEGLPETASEEGRLTKYAALAMISRVALYEGSWQKFHNNGSDATSNTTRSSELFTIAKEAAKEVMDSGKYQLFYNSTLGNHSYRYMFILEDAAQCNPANVYKSANTEYIFSHRHRDGDQLGVNITQACLANSSNYFLTRKLANLYLCSDGLPIDKSPLFQGYSTATSEYQDRDNRMENNMLRNEDNYWNNDGCWRVYWNDNDLEDCFTMTVTYGTGYHNRKWAVERQVEDYYESMDYPIIRYAEVLLNYAEATYELDGSISDDDLDISLNLVRLRVNPDMPKLSNTLVSSNDLDMREEIRRERTVELIVEGFRIDDLKRWATAPDEMPEDQLGIMYTGTWFESNWASVGYDTNDEGCLIIHDGRTWDDKLYLYPLPSDQLQLNPQLEQNPGWGN